MFPLFTRGWKILTDPAWFPTMRVVLELFETVHQAARDGQLTPQEIRDISDDVGAVVRVLVEHGARGEDLPAYLRLDPDDIELRGPLSALREQARRARRHAGR